MKQIEKQAKFFGRKLPKKTVKSGQLLPGLGRFYQAWWDLNTERQIGDFELGPIPWSAVDRYALTIGYRGLDRDYFVRVIRRTDSLYLESLARKREATRAAATNQVPHAHGKRSQKRPQNRARQRNP